MEAKLSSVCYNYVADHGTRMPAGAEAAHPELAAAAPVAAAAVVVEHKARDDGAPPRESAGGESAGGAKVEQPLSSQSGDTRKSGNVQ